MTVAEALKAANAKLQKKIDDALNHEVYQIVRIEEHHAIDDVVYAAHSPKWYSRRGVYGGMADISNIVRDGGSARGGVLRVINITPPNPGGTMDNSRVTVNKDLPKLIEFGHGSCGRYDFPNPRYMYMQPRPFTEETISRLQSSKEHVDGLAAGLIRQGVDVL